MSSDVMASMQAEIKPIPANTATTAQVQVIWNELSVEVTLTPRGSSKYNKVTNEGRKGLIQQVRLGSSIIEASRKLGINYSTAKSIFQTLKARASGRIRRKRQVQSDLWQEEGKTSSWRMHQNDDFHLF